MSWDSGLVSLTNHVQLIAKPFLISTFLFGFCSSAVKTNYCSGRLVFHCCLLIFPLFPKSRVVTRMKEPYNTPNHKHQFSSQEKIFKQRIRYFCFEEQKFDFLVVTVASIWSRETYSLHRLNAKFFQNNCEKERTVNVLFKVNSRKFSYFSKLIHVQKKSYPKVFNESPNASIQPTEALREGKRLL